MDNQSPPQQPTHLQSVPPITPKSNTIPLVIGAIVLVAVGFGAGYMVRGNTDTLSSNTPTPTPYISPSAIPSPSVPVPTYDTRTLPTPTKDPRTPEEKRKTKDGVYTYEMILGAGGDGPSGDDIKISRLDGKSFSDGKSSFLVSEITGKKFTLQPGIEPYWQSDTELVIVPLQDIVRVVDIVDVEKKTIKQVPAGS